MTRKTLLIISAILFVFICITLVLSGKPHQSKSAIKVISADSLRPIIIYGDSRSNHAVHKKIISCIIPMKPLAVFHTGDLVYNGKSDELWSIFNTIVGDLLKIAPMYPALGNHELGDLKIQQDLSLPNEGKWYSIDIQNIHFVVLDVESDFAKGSEQNNWILQDLQHQPSGAKYTIVITHYPFYSTGFHQTETAKLREELIPLFIQYGVDMVFSGHNHCYERCFSDKIYYITTAGGGAPLYGQKKAEDYSQLYVKTYHFCALTQQHDSLFVTALDTNLVQIDRFFIVAQ
jgi:acid phosphatase type 7